MHIDGKQLSYWFAVLLRIILGCVFVFASIDKIADPQAFASSIMNYRVVTHPWALVIATVLPWMELLAGLGLITTLFARGSSLLTMLMLLVFTILVGSAMLRGLDISCGCFTQDPGAAKIGWQKLGENILLITANAILVWRNGTRTARRRQGDVAGSS